MDAKSVVLAIADISGYTEFMLSHEKSLAHSQMIVSEVLGVLVEEIRPPLELVELEGDAVFMYAPKDDTADTWPATRKAIGEQLLRIAEVFASKVRELQAYSICLCGACANIEGLRLKTVIHSGEVVFPQIGRFHRLSGVDVITAHRLLKNSVDEDEYILMTEAAYGDVEFPQPLETFEGEEVYGVGSMRTYVCLPPSSDATVDDFAPGEFALSGMGVEILRHDIRHEYTEVANTPDKGFHFHTGAPLAAMLGYPDDVVANTPASCMESFAGTGNPFSLGEIAAGSNVVDIGSGAGFDSLIAAGIVGPAGAVVGVEMTPGMLHKARQSAAEAGIGQVEFREGYAEELPVPDEWADVVISNGVVNLCPDKAAVYGEMYRVLKPGGRLQLADIIVQKEIPDEAKRDIDLWTG
ncbi:DUF2652 domain-containing protein [Candidatus Poribacteria bacterium]|jgi:arsenite methyltransferase|nr:DUF2652 domain-containing protein [Candidatus Poribacteria bacterium]MBT5535237.1 DUF2652 domain-containing protein [Candidatus Poribacteria bacterium]MBT5709982.1 DUF2652 domain-containing protein [Candidatus Poribacteria bacterium]MBT7098969.1 DUF2652 domain-containing protein [Candidatus Poribacteria bacterium]MBT7808077.1 DUF2652 domain-containing protein [Candidatus Poribacteria bacterium]